MIQKEEAALLTILNTFNGFKKKILDTDVCGPDLVPTSSIYLESPVLEGNIY
jgi:hypothetical protein